MADQKIRVTTDVVVQKGEQILLIKRKRNPFKGMWALPGGFIENEEKVATGALRELKEETNIEVDHSRIRFIRYFDAPGRDPRGRAISFAFATKLEEENVEVIAGDDAGDAQWFDISNLPTLAFDHANIVSAFLEEIRS